MTQLTKIYIPPAAMSVEREHLKLIRDLGATPHMTADGIEVSVEREDAPALFQLLKENGISCKYA